MPVILSWGLKTRENRTFFLVYLQPIHWWFYVSVQISRWYIWQWILCFCCPRTASQTDPVKWTWLHMKIEIQLGSTQKTCSIRVLVGGDTCTISLARCAKILGSWLAEVWNKKGPKDGCNGWMTPKNRLLLRGWSYTQNYISKCGVYVHIYMCIYLYSSMTYFSTKTFQGAMFWNPYRVFFKGLRFDTP